MKRLVTSLLALFIIAGLNFNANADHHLDSVVVEFNVDIGPYADTSDIDLENDSLYISGGDFGWAEPGTNHDLMLMDEDNDSVYTYYHKMGKLDTTEYKFFNVPSGEGSSWSYGEWDGDPNRKVIAYPADTLVLNKTFAVKDVQVDFNVDMKEFADTSEFNAGNDTVYFSGSPVGWAQPGTNPATRMYDLDEDSIYSITLFLDTISTMTYEYKYFYVPEGDGSSWSYGEWDGGSNRMVEVDGETSALNEYWGGYKAMVSVMDASDNAIEGAKVVINADTSMTNTDGMSWGVVQPDTDFDLMVMAEGYKDYSETKSMPVKDTTFAVALEEASAINGVEKTSVKMYPNPVSKHLYFENLDNVNRIEISNMVGQKVKAISNFDTGKTGVNVSDLKNGIYIISLHKSDGSVKAVKMLKE